MKKAVVFCGGEISGFDFDLLENAIIIGVDRGIDYIINNNIKLDFAIGDFDSINAEIYRILREQKIKIKTYDKDKDFTDLDLTFDYLVQNTFEIAYVFGALGNRFDHSLVNLYMLKKYKKLGLNLIYIDEKNFIKYIDDDTEVKNYKNRYKYISILPTNEDTNIDLNNVKWELKNYELRYGESKTISNEFLYDKIPYIKINNGDLYLLLSRD